MGGKCVARVIGHYVFFILSCFVHPNGGLSMWFKKDNVANNIFWGESSPLPWALPYT